MRRRRELKYFKEKPEINTAPEGAVWKLTTSGSDDDQTATSNGGDDASRGASKRLASLKFEPIEA